MARYGEAFRNRVVARLLPPESADNAILAARHEVYLKARERNPARWSGDTRNWAPIGPVTLNPERDSIIKTHLAGNPIQPLAA